jgi:hypothetical protein
MLGLLQAYKIHKQQQQQGSVSEYKPSYVQSSGEVWRRQPRHSNPPQAYGWAAYSGHGVPQYCDVHAEQSDVDRQAEPETQTASVAQPRSNDVQSRSDGQEQPPQYQRYEQAGDQGRVK